MKVVLIILVVAVGVGGAAALFFRSLSRDFDRWENELWDDDEVCVDVDCPCSWRDS